MLRLVPSFALLIVCQCATVLAEGKGMLPAIEIGRPVAEMTAILREHKIEWREANFAETRTATNSDIADVVFDLGEEMLARIYYSTSRKVIVGISVIVQPTGQGLITHSTFKAKCIRLEDDGSYSVQYVPKPKADDLAPVKRNEIPRGKDALPIPSSKYAPPISGSIYAPPRPAPQMGGGTEEKKSPLEGDWEVCSSSYQSAGGVVSYKFRGARLIIESWSGGDKRLDAPKTKSVGEYTFKIDDTSSPPRLVMTTVERPGKLAVVLKDAFEVKDGELWLCRDSGQQITSKSFLPGASGWLTGLRRIEKRPR